MPNYHSIYFLFYETLKSFTKNISDLLFREHSGGQNWPDAQMAR